MNIQQNINNECTANCSTPCAVQEIAKKEKNIEITNKEWLCEICNKKCNSKSQLDVHLMSMKHKNELKPENPSDDKPAAENANINSDDNNNVIASNSSIHTNEIAKQFNIDASKYFIPPDKKDGKYKKFGFYCDSCGAYMTGQIQLIMHLKGRKHLEKNPNENKDNIAPPPKKKYVKKYNPSTLTSYESVNNCQLQQQFQVQQLPQAQNNPTVYQQQPQQYQQQAVQYHQQSLPQPQPPQHHQQPQQLYQQPPPHMQHRHPLLLNYQQHYPRHPGLNFYLPVNQGESIRPNKNGIITNDQKCPIRDESNQSANTETIIQHAQVIMTDQPQQQSYYPCQNGHCGQ